MAPEPQKDLPYHHRTIMFWFLVVFFVGILPIVVLYTSGYRLVQTENGERVLTTTGGFYTAVFNEDIDLFINDTEPQDRRPFSSAFYTQGFDSGMYEVRTQGEGLETWVKNLPVYSQIVTQSFAFNLPRTPVVRLITQWNDEEGSAVIGSAVATSTTPLQFATTTNEVIRAPLANASSTLLQNPEYTLFTTLFASTTEERNILFQNLTESEQRFSFGSEVAVSRATTSATTTRESGDLRLTLEEGEVYASWVGDEDEAPYYFCVPFVSPASTTSEYGAHVYQDLVEKYASTTGELSEDFAGRKLCRDAIRIDRKWQEVEWFEFMPGNSDLVVMHLEDGIYVVEIDDRAWQNVQLLYPGTDLTMLIDAGRIMVRDGEYIVEVFTEIPQ